MWKSRSVKNEPKPPLLAADTVNQAADRIVENAVFLYKRFNLVERVHNRRVVFSAELPADLRVAMVGQPLTQIHRYLSWNRDRSGVVL